MSNTTDELTYSGHLVIVTCWCGTRHGVPSGLRKHQMREHNRGKAFDVYCPLGHAYIPAGKSDVERERERRQRAEDSERFYREQLASERRSAAALRGHITRLKNRIVAGVCPVPGCIDMVEVKTGKPYMSWTQDPRNPMRKAAE